MKTRLKNPENDLPAVSNEMSDKCTTSHIFQFLLLHYGNIHIIIDVLDVY
jgi:hypothetical protein